MKNKPSDEVTFRDQAYLIDEEPNPLPPAAPATVEGNPAPVPGVDTRRLEEAATEPDNALREMYVSKDRNKVGSLTIQEGLPEVRGPRVPFLVKLLVTLVILGAIGALPFFIQKTYIDLQGNEVSVSLINWAGIYKNMDPELKAMQKLTPQERDFVITHRRVEDAAIAAGGHMAETGFWPKDINELVTKGAIKQENAVDPYGFPLLLRLQPDQEMKVISPGPDGQPGTADDVALHGERWTLPSEFENERIQNSLSF